MNKFFVLFAFCLINISLAARLPRETETKDSSSSEEVDLPEMLSMMIKITATAKNITLNETQKSNVTSILKRDWDRSANDMDEMTQKDVENLKTNLSAVIPAEVAEDVASLMSKFTKEASSDEAAEGFVRVLVLLIQGTVQSLDEIIKTIGTETKA